MQHTTKHKMCTHSTYYLNLKSLTPKVTILQQMIVDMKKMLAKQQYFEDNNLHAYKQIYRNL